MKVVITGANGQVGRALVKEFMEQKDVEVHAFDKHALDITCELSVRKTISSICPNVIINAAAYTNVDSAENDQENCMALNRNAVKFLANSANLCGAVLIHISTDYVFDGKLERPYKENDLVNPQSIYGASKLEGEDIIKSQGSSYIILRTSWVFGEDGKNFVKTMLNLGRVKEEIGIVSDQIGGPTYSGDIAKAIVVIAKKMFETGDRTSGIYHFSGFPYVSWFRFAERIFFNAKQQGILNSSPKLKPLLSDEYPTAAERPENSSLCCKSIKERFGIEPSNWELALTKIERYAP